jgi:hypothetical protein
MVVLSIASLKVATTLLVITTPVAPLAGTIEATVGAVVPAAPALETVGEQPITANPAMNERMSKRFLTKTGFFMDSLPLEKHIKNVYDALGMTTVKRRPPDADGSLTAVGSGIRDAPSVPASYRLALRLIPVHDSLLLSV